MGAFLGCLIPVLHQAECTLGSNIFNHNYSARMWGFRT